VIRFAALTKSNRILADSVRFFLEDVFGDELSGFSLFLDLGLLEGLNNPAEAVGWGELPEECREMILEDFSGLREYQGTYCPHTGCAVIVLTEPFWRFKAVHTSFHEAVHHVIRDSLEDFAFILSGDLPETMVTIRELDSAGLRAESIELSNLVVGVVNEAFAHVSTAEFVDLLMDSYRIREAGSVAVLSFTANMSRYLRGYSDKILEILESASTKLGRDITWREPKILDELADLVKRPDIQEYIFNAVDAYLRRRPAEVADKYPELFLEREEYVGYLLEKSREIEDIFAV